MKIIVLFTLCLFISTSQIKAETYVTSKKSKVRKLLKKLKSEGTTYRIFKKDVIKNVYSVLIKTSALSKIRLKKVKKVKFKNQFYYIQYSSTKSQNAKRYRDQLKRLGIDKQDLKIIKRKQNFYLYTIKYNEEVVKEVDEVESELNLSLAQSRLHTEFQQGEKGELSSIYSYLLTGVEIEEDYYSGKFLARINYDSESNEYTNINESNIELDEFYLNKSFGDFQVTIGKQLFSWGTFDELSSFDRVNLKNTKRFVFDFGEEFRRPITAFRIQYYFGDYKLDTFFDFGLEEAKSMDIESRWSGLNQETGIIRGVDPSLVSSSLVKNVTIHEKQKEHVAYGLRLSYSGEGDFSFNYLNAYSENPALRISTTLRNEILLNSVSLVGLKSGIDFDYFRENVFGIDYSNNMFGDLYKFEFSYTVDAPMLSEDLRLVKVPKFKSMIGGDIEINLFATTLTWQYSHEKYSSDTELLLDDSLDQFVLNSSSFFLEDKLEAGLRVLFNISDSSRYTSPFFNYELSDNENLGMYYSLFEGSDNSFFGHHSDDSLFGLKFQRLF